MREAPLIPEEALQAAEVIENAFRLLGVEGPEDAATVVLGALAEQGHVIVSAEDLDIVMNRGDKAGWTVYSCACERLRAALPGETTSDA